MWPSAVSRLDPYPLVLGTESQRGVETYFADDAMLAIPDRNDTCSVPSRENGES